MKLKLREREGVAIIELGGDLVGGPDAERFHNTIKELIDRGTINVVADLGNVKHINSPGLGILMAAVASLGAANGFLKLLRVGRKISNLLMVTRLSTIFETYEDEDSAVASFSS